MSSVLPKPLSRVKVRPFQELFKKEDKPFFHLHPNLNVLQDRQF